MCHFVHKWACGATTGFVRRESKCIKYSIGKELTNFEHGFGLVGSDQVVSFELGSLIWVWTGNSRLWVIQRGLTADSEFSSKFESYWFDRVKSNIFGPSCGLWYFCVERALRVMDQIKWVESGDFISTQIPTSISFGKIMHGLEFCVDPDSELRICKKSWEFRGSGTKLIHTLPFGPQLDISGKLHNSDFIFGIYANLGVHSGPSELNGYLCWVTWSELFSPGHPSPVIHRSHTRTSERVTPRANIPFCAARFLQAPQSWVTGPNSNYGWGIVTMARGYSFYLFFIRCDSCLFRHVCVL